MIRRRHSKAMRRRHWDGLREKRSRSIFLLPSLLTTGNLFCGFLALLLTVQGRYTDAAIAVFVAMVVLAQRRPVSRPHGRGMDRPEGVCGA